MLPLSTEPLPRGLNLAQFIQTVIAGVSGLDGTLVRPKWQPQMPKSPDASVNWIAMGIDTSTPDANAYVATDDTGKVISQRHEGLEVGCSFYGPDGLDYAILVRDGFQIQANRAALKAANMGFTGVSETRHVPDLLNGQWVDRWVMTILLRREIQRVYPILTITSLSGTVHVVLGNEEYLLNFSA